MHKSIYSIYDHKVKAYLQPFFIENDAAAIRATTIAVNTTDHNFNKYPEDYTLFCLGTWDERLCLIKNNDELKTLGTLANMKDPLTNITNEQISVALEAIKTILDKGN